MRNAYAILGIAFLILIIGTILLVEKDMLTLTSTDFSHNGSIPSEYTCDGENINPSLKINNTPENTQSLALIMYDPDIPQSVKDAKGVEEIVHWVVFNIPSDSTEINENVGVKGINSYDLGYLGPCPPDGEHRYFFKLYALDIQLSLPEGSTKYEVEKEMEGHILEQTELIGLYKRN